MAYTVSCWSGGCFTSRRGHDEVSLTICGIAGTWRALHSQQYGTPMPQTPRGIPRTDLYRWLQVRDPIVLPPLRYGVNVYAVAFVCSSSGTLRGSHVDILG
jgi:hypothetical protein